MIHSDSLAIFAYGEDVPRKIRGESRRIIVQTARELRKASTLAERILWEEIRNGRFYGLKFRRQHPFGRFVLDFYCAEFQIAIELDGPVHENAEQAQLDSARTEALQDYQIQVLRFTNEEIENQLKEVLQKILQAVKIT